MRLPSVVSKLRQADPSIVGWAMIDTGASKTCISPRIVDALGLKQVGDIKCGGVGGEADHRLFRITFEFEGSPIRIPDIEVIEAHIENQGLDMLVGRDVLSVSALTYHGPTGSWRLEIPAEPEPPFDVAPALHAMAPGHGTGGPLNRQKTRSELRKQQKQARKNNRH